MIEIQATLLVVVALLGVGCGISVGWILHANYVKAHPAGIEAVAKMAAGQLTAIERATTGMVGKVEEAYLATNGALQNALANLSFAARPGVSDGPAEPSRPISMEDAAARVTGDPMTDRTKLRDALLERGIPPAAADEVLNGKFDDIPPGTMMAELVDRIVAEQTAIS